MPARKAVFVGKSVLLSPQAGPVELARGAAAALPLLHAAGYRIVVVSNEPGIAHGFYTEQSLGRVQDGIAALVASAAAPIAAFYYCPHDARGSESLYAFECDCRLPDPGLLLQSAAELKVNLTASWMLGGRLDDIEAAHVARCGAVLVDNGDETEWDIDELRRPDAIAVDLTEAAIMIASSPRGIRA
jgi:histidinol-phosphate phosphatase family protein